MMVSSAIERMGVREGTGRGEVPSEMRELLSDLEENTLCATILVFRHALYLIRRVANPILLMNLRGGIVEGRREDVC